MSVRVLIADDHPIVRMGIEGLMAHYPELELIGEAMTGDEAIRLCVELQPDVLVLDINMPGLKAVQVLRQLQQCQLPTRVLVMTSYSDTGIVNAMLQAGATGYLLKDDGPAAIIEAVTAVAAGQIWFSPMLEPILASNNSQPDLIEELTSRENEILKLITQGLPNKEIALQTSISERTVEFHITQIYRKLNLTSRVELAVWAKEHQICGF